MDSLTVYIPYYDVFGCPAYVLHVGTGVIL